MSHAPPIARPLWPKSLRLEPQQFQATDRYRQAALTARMAHLAGEAPGFYALRFDDAQLATGTVQLNDLIAVLPSGEILDRAQDVSARSVEGAFRPSMPTLDVFIASPLLSAHGSNVDVKPSGPSLLRYRRETTQLADDMGHSPAVVDVPVLRPAPRLVFEGESTEGLELLFAGRLSRRAGRIELDGRTVPPVRRVQLSGALEGGLARVLEKLEQARADLLSLQRWSPAHPDGFVPLDAPHAMMLVVVTTGLATLGELLQRDHATPEEAYVRLGALAASLAFLDPERAPRPLAAFDNGRLGDLFDPLFDETLRLLTRRPPAGFTAVDFTAAGAQLLRARLSPESFDRPIYLAAQTDEDERAVAERLPGTVKLGTSEVVAALGGSSSRGIPLVLDHSPPPVLPVRRGLLLFRLDNASPFFGEARKKGELVLFQPAGEARVQLRLLVLEPRG